MGGGYGEEGVDNILNVYVGTDVGSVSEDGYVFWVFHKFVHGVVDDAVAFAVSGDVGESEHP